MAKCGRERVLAGIWLGLVLCSASGGCYHHQVCPPDCPVPRELDKVSLPAYVIEPPDILVLDALKTVPLPPYRIQTLDTLLIRVPEPLPGEPVEGIFIVDPDGTVNLGYNYGTVKVVDLTKEQAQAVIRAELAKILKNPDVNVSVAQSRAQQQIRGEHLVYPDGTVNLGLYGSARVVGLTVPEAKQAIEAQLGNYLEDPEVSVSVQGFNSKLIYVITDGGGYGEQVVRLPSTGNETVLDVIAQVNGLASQASKSNIWVARPAPAEVCRGQILPVDWRGITQYGQTATNYQLLPGDRVYVRADSLIATNNFLSKLLSPVERVLGVVLLGTTTVQTINNGGLNNGGFGGGF